MAVPSPSPSFDKAALRQDMKARRRAYARSLAAQTREALEAALVEVLQPLVFAARIIAAYQPMKDEISPLPVLRQAATQGKITALPAFAERDSRMTFRPGAAIEPGPWGLLQPSLSEQPVVPDLLLVPLVACDRAGNRIGMGQGHYDRALAGLPQGATLVGLGWDFQLSDHNIEADPWDQQLNAFASPSGLMEFAR